MSGKRLVTRSIRGVCRQVPPLKHMPAHKHPHKSFVIAEVAALKVIIPYVIFLQASALRGEKNQSLGEYINPCRSAKFSSNFTPEWTKT